MSDTDVQYMKRALRLAQRGEGFVEPNPMVGCVIVKNSQVIGQGWHRRFGQAHAEINALNDVACKYSKRKSRGATVYVTLEPCSHYGKTGPCVDKLIDAGVGRVVIGVRDPSPLATGGVDKLRAAGIEVVTDICQYDAKQLIAPFEKVIRTQLPWVIAKWAQTIDGYIATRTGDSRWVSNDKSRLIVHNLRARVDAIVVGVATVIADNPMLTARNVTIRRTLRRVVVDPKLRLPMRCNLINTINEAPLTIVVSKEITKTASYARKLSKLRDKGVDIVSVAWRRGTKIKQLDLSAAMRLLVSQYNATNILVEGGGRTHGAFVDQNLIDETMVFVSPKLLGDEKGIKPVRSGKVIKAMHTLPIMTLTSIKKIGDDILLRYHAANNQ